MGLRTGRARVDLQDLVTGLVLLLVAGLFAATALRRLAIGTPASMGPGFFPLMVAAALAAAGLLIAIRSLGRPTTMAGFVGVRAALGILGAPVLFALSVEPFGFVPSIAAASLLAALSSRLMTPLFAAGVTVGLTALSTVLFVWMLKMPVSLFGSWFEP